MTETRSRLAKKSISLLLICALLALGMCHHIVTDSVLPCANATLSYMDSLSNVDSLSTGESTTIISSAFVAMDAAVETQSITQSCNTLVPVKLYRKSNIRNIFRSVMGLVLVEVLPQSSTHFFEAIWDIQAFPISTLCILMDYVHCQDGEK